MSDVAYMYYIDGLKEKQIGHSLKISSTHVGRILKKAREQHIVDIRINRQHTETLRQGLIKQFELLDVRITQRFLDDDESRKMLAREAARYFDETVIIESFTSIGISGGRTIHRMVDMIKPQRRNIKIYPLTGIWRDLQISYVDSGVLVHSLWLKCLDAAEAYWFPIEPITGRTSRVRVLDQRRKYLRNQQIRSIYRAAKTVDVAFIGVGPLRVESSTIKQLRNIGMTHEFLRQAGAIGIAAGVWYNKLAQPVIDDYFLSVPIKAFRALVRRGKRIVVVAGGDEKLEAIFVLLKNRVCNVLVTDSRTAYQLLERGRSPS